MWSHLRAKLFWRLPCKCLTSLDYNHNIYCDLHNFQKKCTGTNPTDILQISYRYPTDILQILHALSWCLGNWLRMLEAALQALVAFAMSSSTMAEASPPNTLATGWWFNMVQHGSTVGPALPWFIYWFIMFRINDLTFNQNATARLLQELMTSNNLHLAHTPTTADFFS